MSFSEHSKLVPVRLHKMVDGVLPTTSLGKAKSVSASTTSGEPEVKHEPQARLVEVQPGIYDIMMTCSCGEQMVVRCESIASPIASSTSIPTPYIPKTPPEIPPVTPVS